jgi:hypothetical protein
LEGHGLGAPSEVDHGESAVPEPHVLVDPKAFGPRSAIVAVIAQIAARSAGTSLA